MFNDDGMNFLAWMYGLIALVLMTLIISTATYYAMIAKTAIGAGLVQKPIGGSGSVVWTKP